MRYLSVLILLFVSSLSAHVCAQKNLALGQTEAHIFKSNSMYGVAQYERYFKHGIGLWGQGVYSPKWATYVLGASYSKMFASTAFVECALGAGYETSLSRPRFTGFVFSTIHLDSDSDTKKGSLSIMYQGAYGKSYWNLGFALYNLTESLQLGCMTQSDGATGPRVQLSVGPQGSIQPWVSGGYCFAERTWGVSFGMRSKISW